VIQQKIFPDARAAAAACAQHILKLLEEAIAANGKASLAISGGSSPRPMFEEMANSRLPWKNVHLFWVDERVVPPEDPQSNYKMARECFIGPSRFPSSNLHRIQAELGSEEAAKRYDSELRDFFGLAPAGCPHFDVIHRGMGADAHTASLFPGEPLIEDHENLVAAVYAQRMRQWRITLLTRTLLAARQTVMLVTGEDKADALHSVLYQAYNPIMYPAQLGLQDGRRLTWFLDEAAASRMTGDDAA
jgi:6-phosphogluconolactonase